MSKRVHFRCLHCGDSFYADVLSKDEQVEYAREHKPFGPTRCLKCGSANLERG
jgi:hypothetical protein